MGDWLADIVTGTLSEPEPATKTADPSEMIALDTDSSEGKPIESDDDPFIDKKDGEQKTPAQRVKRMGLMRAYSNPTYPEPMELEQTELNPYVSFSLTIGSTAF